MKRKLGRFGASVVVFAMAQLTLTGHFYISMTDSFGGIAASTHKHPDEIIFDGGMELVINERDPR